MTRSTRRYDMDTYKLSFLEKHESDLRNHNFEVGIFNRAAWQITPFEWWKELRKRICFNLFFILKHATEWHRLVERKETSAQKSYAPAPLFLTSCFTPQELRFSSWRVEFCRLFRSSWSVKNWMSSPNNSEAKMDNFTEFQLGSICLALHSGICRITHFFKF